MIINIYREEIKEDPKEVFERILSIQGYKKNVSGKWIRQDSEIEPCYIYDGGILAYIDLRCSDLDEVRQIELVESLQEFSEHIKLNITFVTIKRLLQKRISNDNFD